MYKGKDSRDPKMSVLNYFFQNFHESNLLKIYKKRQNNFSNKSTKMDIRGVVFSNLVFSTLNLNSALHQETCFDDVPEVFDFLLKFV